MREASTEVIYVTLYILRPFSDRSAAFCTKLLHTITEKNFSAIWAKALATGFTPKGFGCLVDSFVTDHHVP